MSYNANFVNNSGHVIDIQINVPSSNTDRDIVLSGEPVIITQESEGLFAPIKSQACTVNIMTDEAKWDLYTTDPQEVIVTVKNLSTNKTLFKGYATPCQYGQDWTTIDVLSLECVDMLSSLKSIRYSSYNSISSYVAVDDLIGYLLSKMRGACYDTMNIGWFWPKYNFSQANDYSFGTTADFLHSIKVNEANFFDDDDEHTPWTCYEVLEEICKFFNVSLVPHEGSFWFIDYTYGASTMAPYYFYAYSVDDGYLGDVHFDKNTSVAKGSYRAGTTEIGTDDFYNIISVNANRYDIDEVVTDVNDEKYHVSITKEQNFGGDMQTWTYTQSHFWFWQDDDIYAKYAFKKWCRLNNNSLWTHTWWSPRSMTEYSNYYSTAMNGYSQYINLPENKYINTIGATFLHYATMDSIATKPTKLDWKDAIMFNCLTDTIRPASTGTMGKLTWQDLTTSSTFQVPVLEYDSDYEMNFSPKDGTSWLAFSGKLWYQQKITKGGKTLPITDTTNHEQVMFPIEDATDWEAYDVSIKNGGTTVTFRRPESDPYFGTGWQLLQMKLQIGDKYWNGSSWTTTASTFYISFTSQYEDDNDVKYDAMRYLTWMDMLSNTDYEDKVGKDGYCIPIQPEDCVKGQLKLTIYTPRMLPASASVPSSFYSTQIDWYQMGPVVFMKDFGLDYVYASDTEWYLSEEEDNDDIKYANSTKDNYKYERDETLKINSWQEGRPIAKSFPIINFTEYDGNETREVCEYANTFTDYFNSGAPEAQEENIISRELRHYAEPRKTVKVHRNAWMSPWARVQFPNTADISGVFVVDKQEYDVKMNNVTTDLIEFGDATIYNS